MTDITVIGGGIVGLATALAIQRAWPGLDVLVLEKEQHLAQHQTGRNSGVIHAGIYYAPGSLKAEFCRRGLDATMWFCRQHGVPFAQTGKLLVATAPDEVGRLRALADRAVENGLDLRLISGDELRELEPNVVGLEALVSPKTGIADFGAMAVTMARLFQELGSGVEVGARVADLQESGNGVDIGLADGRRLRSRYVIACGGVQADRLARMCGVGGDFAIVPFKGEYYRLAARHNDVVRHLIYPVPDPALPFLGIHLTRMVGGFVTVGPNAVLSLARENYGRFATNLADMAAMAGFRGFWRTIGRNLSAGVDEMANSAFKRRFLRACQRYCPALELDDLEAHPAGIRAQAVLRDGTLVHDFLIRRTARTIHICNAPSPAATSAMPIAEHVRDLAAKTFALKAS